MCACVCVCLHANSLTYLVESKVLPPLLFEGSVILLRNVVRGNTDMERVLLGQTLPVTVKTQVTPRHISTYQYIKILTVCVSVRLCVTEVGCSYRGAGLHYSDARPSYFEPRILRRIFENSGHGWLESS